MATELLERFKKLYDLTLDDTETMIWVQPKNKWEFIASPLPKDKAGCILISMEDYIGIQAEEVMFSEDLKSIVPFVPWSYKEYRKLIIEKYEAGLISELPIDIVPVPDWVTPETENLPISRENFPFLFEDEE